MRTSAAIPFDRVRPGPRLVSRGMVLALCVSGLGLAGWLLLGVSSLFFFSFGVPELLTDMARGNAGSVVVSGRVAAVSEMSMTVDKTKVRSVSFTWEHEGKKHAGESFRTGEPRVGRGDAVDVLVDPERPETAVIRGMRRTVAPRGVVFIVLFPLAGLALVASGTRSGLRNARLLREGELAKGKLVRQRHTGAEVNEKPVIEYTFSFRTRRGEERTASVSTSEPRAVLDDAEEPLFYDPLDPAHAVLLGALPGDPRIDDAGNFTAPDTARLRLVVPAVALLAWAIGFASCT